MNVEKLMQAEVSFLHRFPNGFDDPGMEKIKKKHNVDKIAEFAHQNLTLANFNRPEFIVETVHKIVSRSSMVSRFEKPKFKNFVSCLNSHEKQALADIKKRVSPSLSPNNAALSGFMMSSM